MPLGSELKREFNIAKDQYILLKDKKNNFIDNNSEQDISDVAKKLDAILDDIMNDRKSTKPISIESFSNNITLSSLIKNY